MLRTTVICNRAGFLKERRLQHYICWALGMVWGLGCPSAMNKKPLREETHIWCHTKAICSHKAVTGNRNGKHSVRPLSSLPAFSFLMILPYTCASPIFSSGAYDGRTETLSFRVLTHLCFIQDGVSGFLPCQCLLIAWGRVHIQFLGITTTQIYSVVCFRSLINMSFAVCAGK